VLICEPEMARDADWEDKRLLIQLNLVSAFNLWEILHFIKLSSWNSKEFAYDICIKIIESSQALVIFLFFGSLY
jgi:hypothetical protein